VTFRLEYEYGFWVWVKLSNFKSVESLELSLLPVVYQQVKRPQKQDWCDRQLSKSHILDLKSHTGTCTCSQIWRLLISERTLPLSSSLSAVSMHQLCDRFKGQPLAFDLVIASLSFQELAASGDLTSTLPTNDLNKR